MNLKRGVLLSVAALAVGSVGVLACTREREATVRDEAASVDECRHDEDATAASVDGARTMMPAVHRGDQAGERAEGGGWFPQGPGPGPQDPGQGWDPEQPEGPPPGWDGRGGREGQPRGWGEERGRGGQGRERGGEMRGRRGHRRGRRGGNERGQGGRHGGGGQLGGMEREMRPWLRALLEQIMALAQGNRGRDQGPPEV